MDKSSVRTRAIKKLRQISKAKNAQNSRKINAHLIPLLNKLNKKNQPILFYMPLKHEANLLKSINYFRKKSPVFTPFVEKISFKMIPYRLPLEASSLGIKEPRFANKHIKNVAIIVVPVIAVDKLFRRIGFGKGMYDRFFESLHSKPIVVFVQPVLCYSKTVVTQNHDIAPDFIVTARGILYKAIQNDRNHSSSSGNNQRCSNLGRIKKTSFKKIRFFSARS